MAQPRSQGEGLGLLQHGKRILGGGQANGRVADLDLAVRHPHGLARVGWGAGTGPAPKPRRGGVPPQTPRGGLGERYSAPQGDCRCSRTAATRAMGREWGVALTCAWDTGIFK